MLDRRRLIRLGQGMTLLFAWLFLALSLLSHLCLRRWHESALNREN